MSARLLVVDDDDLIRASLELEAEEAGYLVVTAGNGPEAVALAAAQVFDVVVCDIRMPGMNGLDAISEIRQLQPGARAIVITGYASPDTPITALKMRVDDYLLKPFDGETFLQSVERVLQRQRRDQASHSHDPGLPDLWLAVLRRVLEAPDKNLEVGALAAGLASRSGFSSTRVRLLYLAGLLHQVEPSALDPLPGLHRLATIIARVGVAEAPLESRILAVAATGGTAENLDPQLLRMLEGLPEAASLPDEDNGSDSLELDNLLRLADKRSQLGHWDQACELYLRLTQKSLAAETRARVLLAWAAAQRGRGQYQQALEKARAALEMAQEHSLEHLAAEAVLEVARLGAVTPQQLEEAGRVFSLWENSLGLAAVDLLRAHLGDRKAALRWLDSAAAEAVLREFPEQARAVLRGDLDHPKTQKLLAGKTGLQVFLLGSFQLRFDGHPVESPFPSRKDGALFAYLAAHQNQVIHEEKLMDMFWQKGGKKGRHSLHNSVSQIRRALAQISGDKSNELLLRKGEGYCLAETIWVDLTQFQRCFQEGQRAARGSDWAGALPALQKAERLAVGELLEGDYSDWCCQRRQQLGEELHRCRSLMAGYFVQQGKFNIAADVYERMLELDNCCQQAYLGLFRCQCELGLEAEAAKTYQNCVKAFEDELDMPPPEELTDLYERLLSQV